MSVVRQIHVGFKKLEVIDAKQDITFPACVMYPTETPASETKLVRYQMLATPDAPIKPGNYPLLILSHGGGGNYLGYLTLMQSLAAQGYVIASLEHYKNNRKNNDLAQSKANLENRPRHASLTIDALYSHDFFKQYMRAESVAVIGHSMGGYTALAIAGGKAWAREKEPVTITPHPWVKAIVLLAPATLFFAPKGALDNVTVPTYLVTAEHDDLTPAAHANLIRARMDSEQLQYEEINNAGHFSFLSPFPKSMQKSRIIPSQDPDGFDRAVFHQDLSIKITQFLLPIFDSLKSLSVK